MDFADGKAIAEIVNDYLPFDHPRLLFQTPVSIVLTNTLPNSNLSVRGMGTELRSGLSTASVLGKRN